MKENADDNTIDSKIDYHNKYKHLLDSGKSKNGSTSKERIEVDGEYSKSEKNGKKDRNATPDKDKKNKKKKSKSNKKDKSNKNNKSVTDETISDDEDDINRSPKKELLSKIKGDKPKESLKRKSSPTPDKKKKKK